MASNATVCKAQLQISDMDRNYYAAHALRLAQHPSETETRLMVRLVAFALYADPALEFGRGLSSDDEPDLWQRSLTGDIELWIELGQPDESRLKKACGRASKTLLIGYGGRGFGVWWEKNGAALVRLKNLRVIEIVATEVEAIAQLYARNMDLQCMIQDGELQMMAGSDSISVTPLLLQDWRG